VPLFGTVPIIGIGLNHPLSPLQSSHNLQSLNSCSRGPLGALDCSGASSSEGLTLPALLKGSQLLIFYTWEVEWWTWCVWTCGPTGI